jgi:hypothetical protein
VVRAGELERATAWLSELAGRGVTVEHDGELEAAIGRLQPSR